MPIKQRGKSGKATSRFDERALYDLVRAVAEQARPNAPTRVTQREWDATRAAAGYADAPSARAICMRLRVERTQQSFSWPELLEIVFSEETVVDRVEIRRRSQPQTKDLSLAHVHFAVHAVAKRLGRSTVRRDEYEQEREAMLAEERRRGGVLLGELLPTRNQLEATARNAFDVGSRPRGDDWNRVLDLVGLERPAPAASAGMRQAPRGLPFAIALHHYVEANGTDVWPSRRRLFEFSKLGGFRLPQQMRPWSEHLEEARQYRADLGLGSPATLPRNATAEQNQRPVKPPLAPIEGAPPRAAWGECIYSDDDLFAALERYDREADSGPRTRNGYGAFATAHRLPAAHYLSRIGGFTAAMAKIRRRRTRPTGDGAIRRDREDRS